MGNCSTDGAVQGNRKPRKRKESSLWVESSTWSFLVVDSNLTVTAGVPCTDMGSIGTSPIIQQRSRDAYHHRRLDS